MKPAFFVALLLTVATPAWAADTGAASPAWSLGGAGRPAAEGSRLVLWDAGSVAAGVASSSKPLDGTGGKGMQVGGFLAWRGDDYRLDATLAPSLDGSVNAGVGAAAGAPPGELGTSYGVRFGAAWAGERFTVNPSSGLGLAEVAAPTNDVNVTFTVNHALTHSLSLTGTAEARHVVGATPESNAAGQNHFLFGAGLGYRF